MSENGLHRIPVMRAALEQIQAQHAKTYWTGQDEVWELNAKCDECRNAYPCATRKMADEALTDRMARTNQGENK